VTMTPSAIASTTIDLSFFDRNHFIVYPKPPLRPASSQDVKHGIVITGIETSLWNDFMEALYNEFDGDYDDTEDKLCVYFHNGPRFLPFPACLVTFLLADSIKS